MQVKQKCVVFWFRRDLRWHDNVGLSVAAQTGLPILPLYIFDTAELQRLPSKSDRRIDYIHQVLTELRTPLLALKKQLKVQQGQVIEIFQTLLHDFAIEAVYANEEYEPEARKRDEQVKQLLAAKGIQFYLSKDHVMIAKEDIVKKDGTPYTIYTPFAKRWRQAISVTDCQPATFHLEQLLHGDCPQIPSLEELGFDKTTIVFTPPQLYPELLRRYHEQRDFPALEATTHLSIALRYGTISIRACVLAGLQWSDTWLSQLIWRDFFTQILYHFPHVVRESFKPAYDRIVWRNNEDEFDRWCKGETGYALVDAGMKQLVATGTMPNRVRMVVASFLCKHLLIDWRWGEAFFAHYLNDYDLALNNGNWQWAAGCGCDAAPYFRVFNPSTQILRFDKDLHYIQQWNPTYKSKQASMIVSHEYARDRALEAYKRALKGNEV